MCREQQVRPTEWVREVVGRSFESVRGAMVRSLEQVRETEVRSHGWVIEEEGGQDKNIGRQFVSDLATAVESDSLRHLVILISMI